MARVVEIAKAVATDLNAQAFAQAFSAKRVYVPKVDLADLEELTVSVMASSHKGERATRAEYEHTYVVEIGIQKKLGQGAEGEDPDPAEIGPLMDLEEEIADYCETLEVTLADGSTAMCTEVETDPVYLPEHMIQQRVFTSVVALTFEV